MSNRAGWFAGVLVVLGAACAGSGTGLDEFGDPLDSGGTEVLEPTLASIQARVFTPICTQCHAGAAAPLGLSLETGRSFTQLIGVPSVEDPTRWRVRPGDPEASYLVAKIEGAPGIVGGRMPLGLPPLSAEQRSAIRRWIETGARPD